MSRLVKLNVSDELWARIEKLAKDSKTSVNSLVTSVVVMTIEDDLEAECSGQMPCDSMVKRALVLTGAGLGLKAISESIKVTEAFVSDVLGAWWAERAATGLDQ